MYITNLIKNEFYYIPSINFPQITITSSFIKQRHKLNDYFLSYLELT